MTCKDSRILSSEKGFSLFELIVVVVILSILVGIAVSLFRDTTKNPANEAHNANVRTLISAMHIAIAEHEIEELEWDENPTNNNLCWSNYIAEWPKIPEDSDAYAVEKNDKQGPHYEVSLDGTTKVVTVFPPLIN